MTTTELLNALLRPTYVWRTSGAIADSHGRSDLDPLKKGAVTRQANALIEIDEMLHDWATSNGYVQT